MTPEAAGAKAVPESISTSLVAFYAGGVPTTPFIGALSKLNVPQFPGDEVERVLRELPAVDPLFRKTVAIASAAILRRGPMQPAIKHWLFAVAQSEFEGAWSDTTTRRVFDRYRAAIVSKNSSESRRAFNAMKLGLLLLYRDGKVDPVELVTEVERLTNVGTKGRSASGDDRLAVEPFLRTGDLNALKRVHSTLWLWLEEARGARNRIREAQEERDRAEERSLKKQDELHRLSTQLDEARSELHRSEYKIAELAEALKTAENNRIHDLHETKGRMRRFVREGVLPRLQDAAEALKMAPPRVEPALERLEIVFDQISAEDSWLTSD